jgi:ATP phosphoribosyltransferase regulatory subunit
MVHQPPSGARDLLPLDVAQKIAIERRLQQVFHRWGYHRIITSTLERLETLMAGGAIDRSTLIQLQDAEDGELGLRPELTASIARAAAMRMSGTNWQPQRSTTTPMSSAKAQIRVQAGNRSSIKQG